MAVHFSNLLLPLVRLVGVCNQCGACCQGAGWRCEHLGAVQDGKTVCGVYESRVDGMPIQLRHEDGTSKDGQCFKDSLAETVLILPHVGGPCSLTIQIGGA
jgi:hypothetical protein